MPVRPEWGGLGFSIPANAMGFQYPRTGDAYVGMIAYEDAPLFGCPNAIFATGWREYIEVQLTAPLQAGVTYCAEYWVNLSDNSRYSTDDHGMYFSTTAVTNLQTATALPFTPQIQNTTGQLADTAGWTKVSGTFTAAGGEQYIIIGNFKNDNNTTVQCFNSNQIFSYAYYLIDDVFVGVDGTCPTQCQLNAQIDITYTGCDAGNAILSAAGTGGSGNLSYQWSNGATTPTLQNATPGTYTVTLTDSAGCSGSDTFQVTLPTPPTVDLGPDTLVCKGESITLAGTATPATGINWDWSTGGTTSSITVTPATTTLYSVEVTDSNGCKGTDSILVEVGITPSVFIDYSQDTSRCLSDPPFPMTFGFPAGGTHTGPGITNNIFDPAAAGQGTHTNYYTACDAIGCCDTDSFTIVVDLCAGMDPDQAAARLQLYPNPSSGRVTLSSDGMELTPEAIQVLNPLGQAVKCTAVQLAGNKVELHLQRSGMYLIWVHWQGRQFVFRVVIQQ